MKLKCKCGHEFNAVQKTKYLQDNIQRLYYECPSCHYTSTILYSDDKLRKLIKKQSKEKNFVKKQEREKIIKEKIAELKTEYEEVLL